MKQLQGKKRFFEGWYFKNQNKEDTVCLIPGMNIEKDGISKAFIQIITADGSYNVDYPIASFSSDKDKLEVKIGNNIFSEKGISADINDKEITLKGNLRYEELSPLPSDIMGPFAHLPLMQCRHGVISMHHKVNGSLSLNGENISFDNGFGYIEKDLGRSFPKKYFWVQCSGDADDRWGLMVSVASIPLYGIHFTGCIASLLFDQKEYRFATYNGVKIKEIDGSGITLTRDDLILSVHIKQNVSHRLYAPDSGHMTREIYESLSCEANVNLFDGEKLIFSKKSNSASFEYCF
ncbi:MAG: tocopherol cyclase family protein [Bacillota bacterium]|nr:tocopherol cyclase family protein [Bacillota bacterium]